MRVADPESAVFGTTLSLDLRSQFGQSVELQCFHFITPSIEFRLMRNDLALHIGKRPTQKCMTYNTKCGAPHFVFNVASRFMLALIVEGQLFR